jgi:hypothetical protein
MGDFKKLIAWQKAHAYAIAVHSAFNGRAHLRRQASARRFCARSAPFRITSRKAADGVLDAPRSLRRERLFILQGGRERFDQSARSRNSA